MNIIFMLGIVEYKFIFIFKFQQKEITNSRILPLSLPLSISLPLSLSLSIYLSIYLSVSVSLSLSKKIY